MHPFVHCRSHMCMCRCRCRCRCLRDCMRARVLTCTRAKQATSGARSYRPKKARVESSCADRCRMFVPPFLRTETCAVALGTLPLRLCVGRCHGEMKPKGVRRPKPSHVEAAVGSYGCATPPPPLAAQSNTETCAATSGTIPLRLCIRREL